MYFFAASNPGDGHWIAPNKQLSHAEIFNHLNAETISNARLVDTGLHANTADRPRYFGTRRLLDLCSVESTKWYRLRKKGVIPEPDATRDGQPIWLRERVGEIQRAIETYDHRFETQPV